MLGITIVNDEMMAENERKKKTTRKPEVINEEDHSVSTKHMSRIRASVRPETCFLSQFFQRTADSRLKEESTR